MKWNNKNVLITGINGFVGTHLKEKLLECDAEIYGLVRNHKKNNLNDNDKITYINGNLTDYESLANAIVQSEPDYIFHLAAQSFVPSSFENPINTEEINSIGTHYLLEAMRKKESDAKIIFAGSSEEYGLVISSKEQYERVIKKYERIYPDINYADINELAITEDNPLRPMNPYAISKVHGDFLTRNYFHSYGLDTTVSRCFNHEGAGRGDMFVTSVITKQVSDIKKGLTNRINIGNVNAFRDWSHINDTINGYLILAQKSKAGSVYNQGSMRTNSIISYILLSLESIGYEIKSISTIHDEKIIKEPTEINEDKYCNISFKKTKVDDLILNDNLNYSIKDKKLVVKTQKEDIIIEFNPDRFRPSDVPILLSDTTKIQKLGAKTEYNLKDIINDQITYFTTKQ